MQISGCFSDINISQGSAAMPLRFGGICYYHSARKLLLSLSVKFLKLVSMWQNYMQKYSGTFFSDTV